MKKDTNYSFNGNVTKKRFEEIMKECEEMMKKTRKKKRHEIVRGDFDKARWLHEISGWDKDECKR